MPVFVGEHQRNQLSILCCQNCLDIVVYEPYFYPLLFSFFTVNLRFDCIHLLLCQFYFSIEHHQLLITPSWARIETTQWMQTLFAELDACFFLDLGCSDPNEIPTLVKHASWGFQKSLLNWNSKLFHKQNLIVCENQNSHCRSPQKHIRRHRESIIYRMGSQCYESNFLSKHLNIEQFNFRHDRSLPSPVNLIHVILKLLTLTNFPHDKLRDVWQAEHRYNPFLQYYFKHLEHKQ